MRQGRDGAEGVLRPPHEEVLSGGRRALALVAAVALLAGACAGALGPRGDAPRILPPVPSRNTAALDDPADRARFACAVTVQRAQGFDPGASLQNGSLVGALVGGAPGAALGALFGLIGDIPGRAAAAGAIAGGGIGMSVGGLVKLAADTRAYERGLAACLAAGVPEFPAPPPGLVEYRLRTMSLRHEAFIAFLSAAELGRGAAGPGLIRLVTTADAGALPWGAALHDRHVAAVPETGSRALGATPVDPRIKLGGARGDPWDEVRWHGKPGERTVWMITARNRRPQEVRRLALSDTTALAHFQPTRPPLFGATPEAAVAVTAVAGADRVLDQARGLAAIVGVNDDAEFPDSVYLVVTHAVSAATYEAVLAWASRRETPDFRD